MTVLRQRWRDLPHKAGLAALLAAWCALFHFVGNSSFGYVDSPSMFGWLAGWYRLTANGETGDELCPLVLGLVAVLAFNRRAELLRSAAGPWAPAVLGVLLGLALHVVGYTVQQVRLSVLGFILGAWASTGVVWGRAWLRATAFPWFLTVFAIPVAAYTDPLTFQLRLLSTAISVGFSKRVLGIPQSRAGTMVSHPPDARDPQGFVFDVVAACSGIRSATLVLLITVVFAFLVFRPGWRRAVVILSAVPLALLGNVLRLVVVFWVGDHYGQAAGKLVETKFGFITYVGAVLGVLVLGRLLKEPAGKGAAVADPDDTASVPDKAAWFPMALVAVLAVSMAVSGLLLVRLRDHQTIGAPGVKVVRMPLISSSGRLARTNQAFLPTIVAGHIGRPEPVPDTDLDNLPPDTSFGYGTYQAPDGSFSALARVVLMGRDRTSIHQPEFCLKGVGWDIRSRRTERIQVPRPHPYALEVQRFDASQSMTAPDGRLLQRSGVYVFWFVADGQLTSSHWTRTRWMIRDLLTRNVLQRWAYVSYFALCAPGDEDATFQRLSRLVAASVPEFQLAAGDPGPPSGP